MLKDDATELVDLQGKTMLPGFIDGHGHIGNLIAALPKLYPPPAGIVDSKETLFREMKLEISSNSFLVGCSSFSKNALSYPSAANITTAQEGGTTQDVLQMLDYCRSHDKLIFDIVAYPIQEYVAELIRYARIN